MIYLFVQLLVLRLMGPLSWIESLGSQSFRRPQPRSTLMLCWRVLI